MNTRDRSCQWGFCDRNEFASRNDLLRHIKKHCAEARPVVRAVHESQDSNESASFRPPHLSSFGAQDYSEPVGSGSGLSFANVSSPPRIYASRPVHTQEDELPPPVFSAPPASIPLVASQLEQVAEQTESFAVPPTTADIPRDTQLATLGTYTHEQETSFHFGFSQVPGILHAVSRETVDNTMEDNSSSSEHFALHYSQLVDTDAMTQV